MIYSKSINRNLMYVSLKENIFFLIYMYRLNFWGKFELFQAIFIHSKSSRWSTRASSPKWVTNMDDKILFCYIDTFCADHKIHCFQWIRTDFRTFSRCSINLTDRTFWHMVYNCQELTSMVIPFASSVISFVF